jgi:STE24 endopeptidase
LQSLVVTLWQASIATTMYLVQWPRVVRSDWHLAAWPLVDELLVLLPVIAPLLLVWAAFYRLKRAIECALAERIGVPPPGSNLAAYLWLHVRHQLGLVLVPALLVIGVQETLRLGWPQVEARGQALWLYAPLLAGLLIAMPLAVRFLWRTSPLEAGRLRQRLLVLCRRERAGVRDILVWHTGGQVANAAVAGVVRGLRYVFLTDALLARLSPDEIAAVLKHELGHIRGRHLPLRLLVLALPLAGWFGFQSVFPQIAGELSPTLAGLGISPALQLSLLAPAGLGAYALLVVGPYSRWLEHDADLATCLNADGTVDPIAAAHFESALRKVAGSARENRLAQWLHPAVVDRVALLRSAAHDSAPALSFRARLRLLAWSVFVAYAAAAILLLL